ncbi:unnamed protein product, partial [Polarella glacialis]
ELSKKCHQVIADNFRWADDLNNARHDFPCLHEDVLDLVAPGTWRDQDSFQQKKTSIYSSLLIMRPPCNTHGVLCPGLGSVDLDTSGLPCTDNSRIKAGRQHEEGPTGPLFIIWALRLKRLSIRMAILENTPDISMQIIYFLLYDMYDVFPIPVDLADVGHAGASRARVYILVVLRGQFRQLCDPIVLYQQIATAIKATSATQPADYMTAGPLEIQLEASEVARIRSVPFRPNTLDLTYLLNEREVSAIHELDDTYRAKGLGGTNAQQESLLLLRR